VRNVVIKDYERCNPEEEEREIKQTEQRISGVCPTDKVLTVNVAQHSVLR